jgi:archaeosine synthase
MNLSFNLDRIQGLVRSGTIRARLPADVRARTPCFIPRVHGPLLANQEYREFLMSSVQKGTIRILAYDGNLGQEALQEFRAAGAIILVDATVDRLAGVQAEESEYLIIHQPYPAYTISESFAATYLDQFLQQLESGMTQGDLRPIVAIDDHDSIDLLERACSAATELSAWAVAIDRYDLGGRGIDPLVRKAIAMHHGMRLDIARLSAGVLAPHQVAHAVAAGFDGFIESGILTAASRGQYFTSDGVQDINELADLPCTCKQCDALASRDPGKPLPSDLIISLYLHDLRQMVSEVAKTRSLIRTGKFRDYFERQCHGAAGLAVFQRRLDAAATTVSETCVDLVSRANVNFIGAESYARPDVVKFRRKVIDNFHFPSRTRTIILLPCSARKPYAESQSHQKFTTAMERGWRHWRQACSEIVITSPIGVVPRQLEQCYPAAHYDVPVTGYWDEQELSQSRDMLVAIITNHVNAGNIIDKIIAHLDGGYRKACELAVESLPVPVEFTGEFESATSRDALRALEDAMRGLRSTEDTARTKPNVAIEDLEVLLDYQFETHVGASITGGDVRSRMAYHDTEQVFDRASGVLLCSIDTRSGVVALDSEAIRRAWAASQEDPSISLKTVTFCGTELKGSNLFRAGIDEASPSIFSGDDVFIRNASGELLGYGRAIMPGARMLEMRSGPIVTIIKKL